MPFEVCCIQPLVGVVPAHPPCSGGGGEGEGGGGLGEGGSGLGEGGGGELGNGGGEDSMHALPVASRSKPPSHSQAQPRT